MKKCVVLCFLVALSVSGVFASLPVVKGAYKGMPTLASVGSEHFEFIYPKNLKDTAYFLRKNAEQVLLDAENYFGVKWSVGKIHVVLTSDTASLNAYYSPYTDSHIVLYITESDNGDLLNYENTVLSVFEHEFAHYFIMKLHGSVMTGFSKVFGPYWCNGIFLPNFMVEGLSVAFESRNGEGRLNYPFAYSILRHAKYEQLFPHYRALGGSLTVSPYKSLEYIAGGAFVEFIRTRYGKPKFYALINGFRNMFSFPALFASVYGKSLDEAWTEFIASIPGTDDVVITKNLDGKQGSYSHLKTRNGSLYYIDAVTDGVYKRTSEGKVHLLTSTPFTVNSFDVSKDEEYFLLSYTYDNRKITRVYEMERGRVLREFDGSRHGGFAVFNNETVVLLTENAGSHNRIVAYNIDGSEISHYDLKKGAKVLGFSPFTQNHFAFIYKDGTDISLAIGDKNFNKMLKFSLPNISVQGISLNYTTSEDADNTTPNNDISISVSAVYNENVFNSTLLPTILTFTFAPNGEFKKAEFNTLNIRGGAEYPVVVGENAYFSSPRFGYSLLSSYPTESLKFEDITERVKISTIKGYGDASSDAIEDVSVFKQIDENGYSRFVNALPFSHPGALIPFVTYDKKAESYGILPALSYFTSDYTETITSLLSIAYNPKNSVWGRTTRWFEINSLSLEAGLSLDVLPVEIYFGFRPTFYFDKLTGTTISLDGFISTAYKHLFSSPYQYLYASLLLGYSKRVSGSLGVYDNGFYLDFRLLYNDTLYKGYGYNQLNGWRAWAGLSVAEVNLDKAYWKVDAALSGRFYHSCIIPIENKRLLTYNLPFYVNLTTSYTNVGEVQNLSGNRTIHHGLFNLTPSFFVVLFAADIETVLSPSFPITINTFVLDAFTSFSYSYFGLDGEYSTGNHRLDIAVGFDAYFRLSPAFLGMAIQSAGLDLGVKYEMLWRSDSLRGNAFYPIPQSKFGTFSFICRTAIDI